MTEEPSDQPVIRDRRRIDPETGELRESHKASAPTAEAGTPAAAGAAEETAAEETVAEETETEETETEESRIADLEKALAERTSDLQRLQAEYLNYKRRVERDRQSVREGATANVLTALLPMLDDIDRADEHGELEGGFKAVADSFHRALSNLGLERYGEVGEAFDPRIHEALMYAHSDDVDGPTCSAILQPGYRVGERILRPARVAVAEPEFPAEPPASVEPEESQEPVGPDEPVGPEEPKESEGPAAARSSEAAGDDSARPAGYAETQEQAPNDDR
ncbi:MAG: nucleotide exchange factor GrpE [Propionibacteriales bacterium]|nr:nucleotide exchange factor GrpE [Propionibacteriales bacterium]